MPFSDTDTTVLSVVQQSDPNTFPTNLGKPGNSNMELYDATKNEDFQVTDRNPMRPDKSASEALPGRKEQNIPWRVEARGTGQAPVAVQSVVVSGSGPTECTVELPAGHPFKVGQYVFLEGLTDADDLNASLAVATESPFFEITAINQAAGSNIVVTAQAAVSAQVGAAGNVYLAPSWHNAMIGTAKRAAAVWEDSNAAVTDARPIPGELLIQNPGASQVTARLLRWDSTRKGGTTAESLLIYDVDVSSGGALSGDDFIGQDSGATISVNATPTVAGIGYVPDDNAPKCALALYTPKVGTSESVRYQIGAAASQLTVTQESVSERGFFEFDYQGSPAPGDNSPTDDPVDDNATTPTGIPYETSTPKVLQEVQLTVAEKSLTTPTTYDYGISGGETPGNIAFARGQYVSNQNVEAVESQNHKGGIVEYALGQRQPSFDFDPLSDEATVAFAQASLDNTPFPIHQVWDSGDTANRVEIYWPRVTIPTGAPLGDRSEKRTYELSARIARTNPTGFNDMFIYVSAT